MKRDRVKGVFNCLTCSLFNVSKDLFDRSSGSYSSLSNSLWEARVIAVISCIKEKEVRLNNFLFDFILHFIACPSILSPDIYILECTEYPGGKKLQTAM